MPLHFIFVKYWTKGVSTKNFRYAYRILAVNGGEGGRGVEWMSPMKKDADGKANMLSNKK